MGKIPRRQFLAGAASVASLQHLAGAQIAARARPRNVLLCIALDPLCFPSYGGPHAVMPKIERMAAEDGEMADPEVAAAVTA